MKRFTLLALSVCSALLIAEDPLVVYSSRNEQLIKPIFERFTQETGIPVRYRTDKDSALLQRLKAEGKRTPADMLMTVDAGNLWQATQLGLLKAVDSKVLDARIPIHLKDPDNHWFGLSVRARTLVYNTNKVNPSELSTYAALASSAWQGKLLLRTSKKVYNQSLVAMLIAQYGEAETEKIVRGWVKNLAQPPFPNDTKLMEALAQGIGSVGIVNSYYFGRLKAKNPDLPLALFWPNQDSHGVHVNISGAGLTAHTKNSKKALRLLEWLAGGEAQYLYANANMEYPAYPQAKWNAEVSSWGTFEPSPMNLAKAGEYQARAIQLMDRAGYK